MLVKKGYMDVDHGSGRNVIGEEAAVGVEGRTDRLIALIELRYNKLPVYCAPSFCFMSPIKIQNTEKSDLLFT